MNRYRLVTILISVVMIFSSAYTKASDSPAHSIRAEQTYALLCSAGILNYENSFDYASEVCAEAYTELYSSFFGKAPENAPERILNSTAVCDLADYCEDTNSEKYSLTVFKDFGLIDKAFRNAYKTMCENGYLNFEKEYLNAEKPLTYNDFFHMLSFFKEHFSHTQQLELVSGKVTNSTSQNNIITISVMAGSEAVDFSFKRGEEFMVYKNSSMAPYSYNIKRDDMADFYSKDGRIVYVCVAGNTPEHSGIQTDSLYIFRSRIYLYSAFENQLILKNPTTGSYSDYKTDSKTLFYKGNSKKRLEEINTLYLDVGCCVIADKTSDTIRYIYIE